MTFNIYVRFTHGFGFLQPFPFVQIGTVRRFGVV